MSNNFRVVDYYVYQGYKYNADGSQKHNTSRGTKGDDYYITRYLMYTKTTSSKQKCYKVLSWLDSVMLGHEILNKK